MKKIAILLFLIAILGNLNAQPQSIKIINNKLYITGCSYMQNALNGKCFIYFDADHVNKLIYDKLSSPLSKIKGEIAVYLSVDKQRDGRGREVSFDKYLTKIDINKLRKHKSSKSWNKSGDNSVNSAYSDYIILNQ